MEREGRREEANEHRDRIKTIRQHYEHTDVASLETIIAATIMIVIHLELLTHPIKQSNAVSYLDQSAGYYDH